MSALSLSLITVNYRTADHLQGLLDSFAACDFTGSAEWIVVDNSPEEAPLGAMLRPPQGLSGFQILANQANPGFGAACNQGAAQATGDVLLFINPDCQFSGGSFRKILERLSVGNKTGAVGPRIRDASGNLEFSWAKFPGIFSEARLRCEKRRAAGSANFRSKMESRFQKARPVDWVTAGAMFMRKAVFDEIGGFDEGYFLYFEDADLCKRLSDAGYINYYDPSFEIVHRGGASTRKSERDVSSVYRASQVRYYSTHHSALSQFILTTYLRLARKI